MTKPVIDIFGKEHCFFCSQAVAMTNKYGFSGTFYRVPEDAPVAWLLLNYPAFESEHHLDGIALPIVLKDGELLGGFQQLSSFLANYKVDNLMEDE